MCHSSHSVERDDLPEYILERLNPKMSRFKLPCHICRIFIGLRKGGNSGSVAALVEMEKYLNINL